MIARILGKTGFGEVGVIQSTVGAFGTFAGFGLGLAATKFVAECRHGDVERAGRIVALSVVSALAIGGVLAASLVGSSNVLAQRTLAAPQLAGLLRIGALLVFLSVLGGAQTGTLAGLEAFKAVFWTTSLSGLFALPLTVYGAYVAGVRGAVWALVASAAVTCVLNHAAVRHETRRAGIERRYRTCWREARVLFSYFMPASLTTALVVPVTWGCNALVVNQPNGYAEMGIFTAAQQWRLPLLFVSGILSQVSLPVLSGLHSSRSFVTIKNMTVSSMLVLAGVCTPICALLIAASGKIMQAYGDGFADGALTLILLQLAALLQVLQGPAIVVLQASGRVWQHFRINLAWCAVLVAVSYVYRTSGAAGLAGAHVAAFVLYTPLLVAALTTRPGHDAR